MLFPATQTEMIIGNGTSREHEYLKIKKGRCKPMDANKSTTNELTLEHTSMRA
jgi:phage FluMu protein Com